VKVEVENDALVIQGERRFEQEEKEGGVQRTERQYGSFIEAFLCRKEPRWTKLRRSSIMAYWK
jgi:HSP20 family molecular chaperone IbpA